MRSSLWLVIVTACWSQHPPTVPPAESIAAPAASGAVYHPSRSVLTLAQRCAKSVGSAFDVAREELERTGLTAQTIDEIEDALAESCETTAWGDATLECIATIASVADWNPCVSQMTEEQREDSTRRAVEILQRRNAYGMGSHPGPPPPPPP